MNSPITFDNSENAVIAWLKINLAKELKCDPESIDINAEFTSFGLDSIVLVTLANDLALWVGRDIDPTIFWEYNSIKHLSRWIVD